MAADPVFAVTPLVGMTQVSTANTNRDGSGTLSTVVTGAVTGTIIRSVRIVATGTTTAGVVRLFLYNGTDTRLLTEILVAALTPSTTVAVFEQTLVFSGDTSIHLPSSSWELRASTHNAETFNIFAFGANL